MDVLVMLDEHPGHSPVLAHVNSVPAPLGDDRRSREVVTLYGEPTAESLALALAAAVEGHRGHAQAGAIRHLGLFSGRGAVGDQAWRDERTGEVVTRDVEIPLEILHATAKQLLVEGGQLIRRLLAGLTMSEWPEGARRALSVSLAPVLGVTAAVRSHMESALDVWREADGLAFEGEAD